MVKKLLPAVMLFLYTETLMAQTQQKPDRLSEFRLNAYTSYAFKEGFESYYSSDSYYSGTVNDGFIWGGGLEYLVHRDQSIGLSYLRMDTKAPTTYYDNSFFGGSVKNRNFDMNINYLFLGSTRYFRPDPMFEPYIGIRLGMAIVSVSNPLNRNNATGTRFAWGGDLGSNIWFLKSVGLKLNLGMQSVVQATGGGLYFGTGGVSAGLQSYSTVYQFTIGGGLVFRLIN